MAEIAEIQEIPSQPTPETAQAEFPQADELPTATENPSETSLGERLMQSGGAVLEKLGVRVKKPGRGRPRNDGSPKKSDIVETVAVPGPQASISTASPALLPDNSLFRRIVVRSVKAVFEVLNDVTAIFARAAGISEDFTKKTLAAAKPKDDDLQDFTESLDEVLKKHNIRPEHAEEWGLVISGGRMLAPYALLIVEFRAELVRVREERVAAIMAKKAQ